jgi:hypothetical protein
LLNYFSIHAEIRVFVFQYVTCNLCTCTTILFLEHESTHHLRHPAKYHSKFTKRISSKIILIQKILFFILILYLSNEV